MKRALALLPIAAAALTLLIAPASAQNWRQDNWNNRGWIDDGRNSGWQQRHGTNERQGGWDSRDVSGRFSDPSYNSGVRFRANPRSRCTEDLGYGRYEYCN